MSINIPAGAPIPSNPASLASVNAAAALRNYKLNPRLGKCEIDIVYYHVIIKEMTLSCQSTR